MAPAGPMVPSTPIAPRPPEPGTVSGPIAPPPRRTIRVSGELPKATQLGAPAVNKKVLIIDADEAVAGIYRAQIEAAGYEVEVALDGETGFHDLYTINPDALLLDLLLPGGLSGSEILKKTRAQKKFEKIPILVFTNIYTRDVEEEAKAAGALRLFNKAAATPRDVIDSLNEIFLPSGAVLGSGAPARAATVGAPVKVRPAAPGNRSMRNFVPNPSPPPATTTSRRKSANRLLQGAPEFVKSLRGLLQVLLRSQGDAEAQSVQLLELYTRVHTLTANSAIAGFTKVARLAGALEAMLREFQAKPEGSERLDQTHAHPGDGFPRPTLHQCGHARERRAAQRANPRGGRRDHQPPRHRAFAGKSRSQIDGGQPSRRGHQTACRTTLTTSCSSTWKCPA